MNAITQFDFFIINFIQENFRCAFLDAIMPVITSLGNVGFIWLLISVILLFFKKTRSLGFQLLISIGFAYVIYQWVMKPIIARPRPFTQNPIVELLIKAPKDFSFPSGHTACGFSFVIILFLKKNKWWIPSLILASIIGFSRMYLYVHFFTDVICGALCGIIFGAISFYFSEKILRKINDSKN